MVSGERTKALWIETGQSAELQQLSGLIGHHLQINGGGDDDGDGGHGDGGGDDDGRGDSGGSECVGSGSSFDRWGVSSSTCRTKVLPGCRSCSCDRRRANSNSYCRQRS